MTTPTLAIGNKTYSSHSLRPWLLLKAHGVEFEEELIKLYQPGSVEKLGLISPSLKVPVLLHDGIRVWDSLAICDYISETFLEGNGWPRDLKRRYAARSIVAELHSGFAEFKQQWPMNCKIQVPLLVTEAIERDIARLDAIMYCCRRKYGDGGHYLFGQFGIADCFMAPICIALQSYAAELSWKSTLYLQHLLEHPAIQEWIAEAQLEENQEAIFSRAS